MDTYKFHSYDPGEGWRDRPEKGERICFSDLVADSSGEYIMPGLLSGGDYASSTLVEKSNHRVFLEEHGKKDGIHDVYGGHGSYGVAIRKDVYESDDDIKSQLDSLEDYPLLDEEDHSNLEFDAQGEAWDNWARHDVRNGLIESLGPYLDDPDEFLDRIEDDLLHLFDQARDEVNEYWICESGGSMWIDIEKITPYLTDRVLLRMPEENLPLLVGREWTSKVARDKYNELMKGPHEVQTVR